MFPLLEQANSEKEFEENLYVHVEFLNDLVKIITSACKSSNYKEIYYTSNELYIHLFPLLSLAPENTGFTFLLDLAVKNMSEMVDKILNEYVTNAYQKLLKIHNDEANRLQALARQEEETAAEEDSFNYKECEPHLDDIINEHYDAILSFDKKSRNFQSDKKDKQKYNVSISNEETSEVKDPIEKKYKENNLKKRKLSKLKLMREDKVTFSQVIDEKQNEEEELQMY
jgi:hypothetical protein